LVVVFASCAPAVLGAGQAALEPPLEARVTVASIVVQIHPWACRALPTFVATSDRLTVVGVAPSYWAGGSQLGQGTPVGCG
jgi:hypothetical protein